MGRGHIAQGQGHLRSEHLGDRPSAGRARFVLCRSHPADTARPTQHDVTEAPLTRHTHTHPPPACDLGSRLRHREVTERRDAACDSTWHTPEVPEGRAERAYPCRRRGTPSGAGWQAQSCSAASCRWLLMRPKVPDRFLSPSQSSCWAEGQPLATSWKTAVAPLGTPFGRAQSDSQTARWPVRAPEASRPRCPEHELAG